jgi:hypothetical protein
MPSVSALVSASLSFRSYSSLTGLDWTNSVRLLLPAREDEAKKRLKAAGYTQLSEREEWTGLEPGRKYFFTRNYSTIVAFAIGAK